MKVLDIYVTRHCLGYEEASRLAEEIKRSLSDLQVNMIILDEMTEGDLPDIPATPSYLLDGQLLFLENPRVQELAGKIESFTCDKRGP